MYSPAPRIETLDVHGESAFYGPANHLYDIKRTVLVLPEGDSPVSKPLFRLYVDGHDDTKVAMREPDKDHDYWWSISVMDDADEAAERAFPDAQWPGGYDLSYWDGMDELCSTCAHKHWLETGVALVATKVDQNIEHRGIMCDDCQEWIVAPYCPMCVKPLAELTDHWPFFKLADDDEGARICSHCMAEMVVNGTMVKTGLGEYELSPHDSPRRPWWTYGVGGFEADMDTVAFHRKATNDAKAYRLEIMWNDGPVVTYHDTYVEAEAKIAETDRAIRDHQWLDEDRQTEASDKGRWWFTLMETGGIDAYIHRQHDERLAEPTYQKHFWLNAHIDNEFETDDIP